MVWLVPLEALQLTSTYLDNQSTAPSASNSLFNTRRFCTARPQGILCSLSMNIFSIVLTVQVVDEPSSGKVIWPPWEIHISGGVIQSPLRTRISRHIYDSKIGTDSWRQRRQLVKQSSVVEERASRQSRIWGHSRMSRLTLQLTC